MSEMAAQSGSLASRFSNPMPAQLAQVSKRFGSTAALSEVSMSIRPGELVALLGPNGAGKTTAVRLLLGLIRATSGFTRVFGGDPTAPENRVRTGAMLQVARVPETLRVAEHIELFSSYYPDPLALTEVLETAGLRGLERQLFGTLSGGQRQRLLFALAICGNPDLLVLDEPTVGLDIEARRGLWQQIRRFVAGGRSVLLTTHYLEEADALADRVIVINHGRIIAEGTPAEIKANTAGKRIRFRSRLDLDQVSALSTVANARLDNGVFELVTGSPEMVVRELLASDPTVTGLEIASAGLEEAFLALTHAPRAT